MLCIVLIINLKKIGEQNWWELQYDCETKRIQQNFKYVVSVREGNSINSRRQRRQHSFSRGTGDEYVCKMKDLWPETSQFRTYFVRCSQQINKKRHHIRCRLLYRMRSVAQFCTSTFELNLLILSQIRFSSSSGARKRETGDADFF